MIYSDKLIKNIETLRKKNLREDNKVEKVLDKGNCSMTTNTKKKYQKIAKQLLNETEDIIINKVFDYFKDNVKLSKGGKSLDDIKIEFIEQNIREETPSLEEKKRGKKHGGEKSKRAPSAYNRFIGDKIKDLKIEGNQGSDNMKIATQAWKALSKQDKEAYKKKHDEIVKKEKKEVD